MPFVNIRVAGSLTREQKAQIAQEITALLERIANKPPEATSVVIEEVSRENWAKAGILLSDR